MTVKEKKNSESSLKVENRTNDGRNYVIGFLVLVIGILIGVVVQQYFVLSEVAKSQAQFEHELTALNENRFREPSEPPFDMEEVFRQMSIKLKEDILNSIREESAKKAADQVKESPKSEAKKQEKRQTIGDEPVEDVDMSKMKLKPGESVILKPDAESDSLKVKIEKGEKVPPLKPVLADDEKQSSSQSSAKNVPPGRKISQMKPKKMWIPIPNSNGGHRRVPAIEITPANKHDSSVKVWLYEEFLSKEECDNLIKAHESHLSRFKDQRPIVCFDSLSTLKQSLIDLNREKVAELVEESFFTQGTRCLNQTFSRQLEKWGLKWSFTTAFYPGESKFSTIFGRRIEEATMLNETHGGKFQLTSFPAEVGYKSHIDCAFDSTNEQKSNTYATFMVYLNDLGPDGGGQTTFSELGIDVKPREGRALTWNSMNYDTGECESKSANSVEKVTHPSKKKYSIQRSYYLNMFPQIGKRIAEAKLPVRSENTPKISCDSTGCRMYDEWTNDHLI